MTQWYVKDLSKLTGVSVQTLHHYDRIDLLNPSVRLANGYRVYSETDLLKLQQIIALKFFGFELNQIKALLAGKINIMEHLGLQAQFLENKARNLIEASKTLKNITESCGFDESIPWKKIIQLIEVYRMTQQLEQTWVKEIFTAEELKEYAAFETEIKSRFTPEQISENEKKWFNLVEEAKANLTQDPMSEIGIALGKKMMDWVNQYYGRKHAHLRTKKFEQGFGEGKGLKESGLNSELVVWLEKAMNAYFKQKIYRILDQVGKKPSSDVLVLWQDVLIEIHGDEIKQNQSLIAAVMEDNKISEEAKKWVLKNTKS